MRDGRDFQNAIELIAINAHPTRASGQISFNDSGGYGNCRRFARCVVRQPPLQATHNRLQ